MTAWVEVRLAGPVAVSCQGPPDNVPVLVLDDGALRLRVCPGGLSGVDAVVYARSLLAAAREVHRGVTAMCGVPDELRTRGGGVTDG